MAEVFISFIHEEKQYAECIQMFILNALGDAVMPFMSSDKFQVFAGEKWLDRIMTELCEAKVVVLMLSEVSVTRPWVNFEAGVAMGRNITIIPVCFGNLEVAALPKPYSGIQALNLRDKEDQYYLASSIAKYLKLPSPDIPDEEIYGIDEAERKRKYARIQEPYEILRRDLKAP